LKTKDRKLEFPRGEAENILKKRQLPKMGGTQSQGDKASGRAEVCTRRTRLSSACKAWGESGRVQSIDIINNLIIQKWV
jgi:hypothetical protein